MEPLEEKYKIVVSNKFVEIYRMLNVMVITDDIKSLSRKELFILLIITMDNHNPENKILLKNLTPFVNEMEIILELYDKGEVKDIDLISLGIQTGDEYINASVIYDEDGNNLAKPLSESEAVTLGRKLNIINVLK
jgi:hypothetical protein